MQYFQVWVSVDMDKHRHSCNMGAGLTEAGCDQLLRRAAVRLAGLRWGVRDGRACLLLSCASSSPLPGLTADTPPAYVLTLCCGFPRARDANMLVLS